MDLGESTSKASVLTPRKHHSREDVDKAVAGFREGRFRSTREAAEALHVSTSAVNTRLRHDRDRPARDPSPSYARARGRGADKM